MTNTVPRASVRQRRKAILALAAGAGALSLSLGTAHATDGYFLNGISAKSKGMGGVAIALPQDALSIASNPASATEVGHRLDMGVDVFIPKRGATIEGNFAGLDGNHRGSGSNPFVLPEMAYVRPLSSNVAVGIAIYGHGGMNTTYKANPFASFGATGTAGVDLRQAFVTPTIAFKFAPGHSIGLSPIAVFQSFKARGISPFAGASIDPANFTNRGTDWAAGYGARVGYLGKLHDRVTVGAFYHSKIWAGRFKKYAGLFAERGGFDVPASYGAGIAVRANDRLTLAGDIKRIEYSGIKSVGTPLAPLLSGIPFGSDDGPGFGWRDINAYKVGASYKASEEWTLRAGYGRSENPVPATQTLLNVLAPGVVQDHFTAGATWAASPGLEFTSYIMHAPKNRVEGSNSIPAMFGGGEANLRLSETSFGIAAGLIF